MNKDGILAAPPVTIVGLKFLGVSLPDWAAIVAIVYTLIMLTEFVVRKYRFYTERKDRRKDDE